MSMSRSQTWVRRSVPLNVPVLERALVMPAHKMNVGAAVQFEDDLLDVQGFVAENLLPRGKTCEQQSRFIKLYDVCFACVCGAGESCVPMLSNATLQRLSINLLNQSTCG